jgi:hypothetical protein
MRSILIAACLLASPPLTEELGDTDQKWACEVLAAEHVSIGDKCPVTPTKPLSPILGSSVSLRRP